MELLRLWVSWEPVHWERTGVTAFPKFLWFHEEKCGLIFPKEGLEREEGCWNFYSGFGASPVGRELI